MTCRIKSKLSAAVCFESAYQKLLSYAFTPYFLLFETLSFLLAFTFCQCIQAVIYSSINFVFSCWFYPFFTSDHFSSSDTIICMRKSVGSLLTLFPVYLGFEWKKWIQHCGSSGSSGSSGTRVDQADLAVQVWFERIQRSKINV